MSVTAMEAAPIFISPAGPMEMQHDLAGWAPDRRATSRRAATRPSFVAAGTAARILTGAPLPPGADAIVPVEEAEERAGNMFVTRRVQPGAHVRRKGEDIREGEAILPRGTVVGAPEVSLLASFSRLSVPVVRRARVAILSTGDELVEPGGALSPGKIDDSNGLAVAAAVMQLGAEPVRLGIARDDRASLRALLAEGLQADALVTSAGVSMGDRDLVREVLDELGVRQVFWKVDIKPGRPTAFAVHGTKPVFSLPGNPVSTLLTFDQFVRPALLKMMGHGSVLRPVVRARFQEDLARKPGRVSFLRVRLERSAGVLLAWTSGNQETGILKTMLRADGIAVIPATRRSLRAGDLVDVQVLPDVSGTGWSPDRITRAGQRRAPPGNGRPRARSVPRLDEEPCARRPVHRADADRRERGLLPRAPRARGRDPRKAGAARLDAARARRERRAGGHLRPRRARGQGRPASRRTPPDSATRAIGCASRPPETSGSASSGSRTSRSARSSNRTRSGRSSPTLLSAPSTASPPPIC